MQKFCYGPSGSYSLSELDGLYCPCTRIIFSAPRLICQGPTQQVSRTLKLELVRTEAVAGADPPARPVTSPGLLRSLTCHLQVVCAFGPNTCEVIEACLLLYMQYCKVPVLPLAPIAAITPPMGNLQANAHSFSLHSRGWVFVSNTSHMHVVYTDLASGLSAFGDFLRLEKHISCYTARIVSRENPSVWPCLKDIQWLCTLGLLPGQLAQYRKFLKSNSC
jgi:hypothetical protein